MDTTRRFSTKDRLNILVVVWEDTEEADIKVAVIKEAEVAVSVDLEMVLEAVSVATVPAINICHRIIITNNRWTRATLPKYGMYRVHFRRQPSRTSLVYGFYSEYGNPSLTHETRTLSR